jgi:hypothetical protein
MLGSFMLQGIPPMPRGVPKIEVTFDFDIGTKLLTVSAVEVSSGIHQSIEIKCTDDRISVGEIDRRVKEAAKFKIDDESKMQRVKNENVWTVFWKTKAVGEYLTISKEKEEKMRSEIPFGARANEEKHEIPPGKLTFGDLPADRKYHVFLSHTWRFDETKRDNHERVSQLNEALKKRGIITCLFDGDRMEDGKGTLRQTMTDALKDSCCVLVCITREYETKINSAKDYDNCYFEFNIACVDPELVQKRIPLVLEKSMKNPATGWNRGRLLYELGGKLCIDASEDFSDMSAFEKKCDENVKKMHQLIYP